LGRSTAYYDAKIDNKDKKIMNTEHKFVCYYSVKIPLLSIIPFSFLYFEKILELAI